MSGRKKLGLALGAGASRGFAHIGILQVLEENGIQVLEMPSSELSRGRGGPRCMSMPLEREEI